MLMKSDWTCLAGHTTTVKQAVHIVWITLRLLITYTYVGLHPRASGWTQKEKHYPFKNNEDETIVAAKLNYSSIIIHVFFAKLIKDISQLCSVHLCP